MIFQDPQPSQPIRQPSDFRILCVCVYLCILSSDISQSHVILNYVYKIERLPADEQDAVMILVSISIASRWNWLLYSFERWSRF